MELKQKQKFDEARTRLEQKRAVLETNTKKVLKKTGFGFKYVYVKGGHIKNEVVGALTVFNMRRAHGIEIHRHIEYTADNKLLYLNTYQPKRRDKSKKLPVFVYIHGGGWIGGLPENREAFTTRVAEDGYFVASIFYGHAPFYSHPKPIENIYKAFAYLRQHAEELNIDMTKIAVGGESAGAHLSAMVGAVATNPEYRSKFSLSPDACDQKICGLVLNCGVFDMKKVVTTGFKNIYTYTECYCGKPVDEMSDAELKEASPIFWVTRDFPPCYLVSAEHDRLAVMTFDMVEKLDENAVPYVHYHGEGRFAVHAFAVAQVLKISQQVMRGVLMFLKNSY